VCPVNSNKKYIVIFFIYTDNIKLKIIINQSI